MQHDPLTTLRALNARFIHNFITNDVPSHDDLIHERFICIGPNGARVSRADYLAEWAAGFSPEKVPYFDYRDEQITVIGDVALVRSVNRYIRVRDGAEITGMTIYTDTYLREGGAWKCIQAQITPVSPENYPPDSTIVRKYVRGEIVD